MLLLTTSTSPGNDKSPASKAIRCNCVDCIQSGCSNPFNRVTINLVIQKNVQGSKNKWRILPERALQEARFEGGVIGEIFCVPALDVLLIPFN